MRGIQQNKVESVDRSPANLPVVSLSLQLQLLHMQVCSASAAGATALILHCDLLRDWSRTERMRIDLRITPESMHGRDDQGTAGFAYVANSTSVMCYKSSKHLDSHWRIGCSASFRV